MDGQMLEIYCDRDHSLMEAVRYHLVVTPIDQWDTDMFRCNEAGCLRHFAVLHGYFDMSDSRIDRSNYQMKHCRKHPGAVAIVAIDGNTAFWNCIHPDCEEYEPTFSTI